MFGAVAFAALLTLQPPGAGLLAEGESATGKEAACALSVIASELRNSTAWQDLAATARRDAAFGEALEAQLPGYGLAFRHQPSGGLLLVGARGTASEETPSQTDWAQIATATQAMCKENGLQCEVAALDRPPYGLQASTHIPDEEGVIRRETLSFSDGSDCGYAVQFTGEQAAFSEAGWQAVRAAMLKLRDLVRPLQQSRR